MTDTVTDNYPEGASEHVYRVASTLLWKTIRDVKSKVVNIAGDSPVLVEALGDLIEELETFLNPYPEGHRLYQPINQDMVQQEIAKIMADATGRPQFLRTMSKHGYAVLRRNMTRLNHGYYGRSVEAIDVPGGVDVYLLPQGQVDTQANHTVD